MAELLLGTTPVLAARVSIPRIGVWVAELCIDTDSAPTGAQTLATADGGLSVRGTVRAARTSVWQGRTELLLIGGADGLSTVLAPRFYARASIRILLTDLCRETGEVLSSACDAGVLASTLSNWTRPQTTGGRALATLLEASGAAWRVLRDGTLWVGPETWPAINPPGDLMHNDATRAHYVWGADTVRGEIAPGTTWFGRRVSSVEHELGEQRSRTEVWFEEPAGTLAPAQPARDRVKLGLDALVANVTRRALFHARFPCVVLGQGADGTLDLQPDDPTLPQLTSVPMRLDTPGSSVAVSQGARVLLGFEGGDPARPFASGFVASTGAVTQIAWDAPTILLGSHATLGIARLTDTADRTGSMGTWMSAVETALASAGHPVPTPFVGETIASISSASTTRKSE